MKEVRAGTKDIRLVFSLARADNPQLYDELVRFSQGVRRVNRLRVLAYGRLLALERGEMSKVQPSAVAVAPSPPESPVELQELFAPSVSG